MSGDLQPCGNSHSAGPLPPRTEVRGVGSVGRVVHQVDERRGRVGVAVQLQKAVNLPLPRRNDRQGALRKGENKALELSAR